MRDGQRRFLLLQGPHGPFFHQLGRMLTRTGALVWRVGVNGGDSALWPGRRSYIPFRQPLSDWPDFLDRLLDDKAITDVVLYGDTRPLHATAARLAQARGLTLHVFEEGYLRPYWVTYERGGSNGHSRLMSLSVDQMRAALQDAEAEHHAPPARWGDMREHMFWGAVYHGFVFAGALAYRAFRPHRSLGVVDEFRLYLRRFLLLPLHRLERAAATLRIRYGGFPYHLVLLQLAHDASFLSHSRFGSMEEFLQEVLDGFARGAPRHHHLVFKAHPLEDGRVALKPAIRRIAARLGVADRVHFVRGGKLGPLLNHARSAVTVNSTAGQQALWRGMPLRIFGDAVYGKPEFVSFQPLPEFFADPVRPDSRAYRVFRQYLLETSQIPGGFYSARGRRQLLRQVVDMMLQREDPYEALSSGKAAPRQQLRLVPR